MGFNIMIPIFRGVPPIMNLGIVHSGDIVQQFCSNGKIFQTYIGRSRVFTAKSDCVLGMVNHRIVLDLRTHQYFIPLESSLKLSDML